MNTVSKFHDWLKPEGLTLLRGWARDGLTDVQIAHNMGISVSALYNWKKRFPELAEALRKGKEVSDYEVESALYRRALGYEYTEVMAEESERGARRRETVKHVAPDVTAQIYWLKNRKPAKWRDRPAEDSDGVKDDCGVVVLAPVEEESP